ncbi:hypothetical protein ZIOFF_018221 [Zingiber officinale]|uniref:Uncharacterized protein n=1 Tax=Zingiber officinale TaxID=94328 RepID=A0A8J5HCP6_ZINOF|nr:hypothetical protein ZIOFF_018221 [Zingiber officinale]
MPLVRLEVRNEYGLGDLELYKKSLRKEDPKAILDGVAVAGLVGILRQLGDLAEVSQVTREGKYVQSDVPRQFGSQDGSSETQFTNLKYSRVEIDEVWFEWVECMLDYI